jgi:hypothetical protein
MSELSISSPACNTSAGTCSILGNLDLSNFSIEILTSKALRSDTNGSDMYFYFSNITNPNYVQ